MEPVNPKDLAATRDKKPPLDLLEYAADVEISQVMQHGADKYGRKNYQTLPIMATVYGGAIRRHVGQWLDGQDTDTDSGLSHLAHIGANIHVLLAAMAAEKFVDDRGPAPRSDEQETRGAASNAARYGGVG